MRGQKGALPPPGFCFKGEDETKYGPRWRPPHSLISTVQGVASNTPRGLAGLGVDEPAAEVCDTLLRMSIRERFAFWRQFRGQFETTGAVQPSSRFLARAMTTPFRRRRQARPDAALRVVEMGPGTGAVTRAIASAMGPGDRLDCYEINPRFAEYLRRAIAEAPEYATHGERIEIHCLPAQQATAETPVDVVICSVPLNNLTADLTSEIFDTGLRLLKPGGSFTYFEYLLLPRIRQLTASAQERARIDAVKAIKQQLSEHVDSAQLVLLNLPPARAVHLVSDNSEGTQQGDHALAQGRLLPE